MAHPADRCGEGTCCRAREASARTDHRPRQFDHGAARRGGVPGACRDAGAPMGHVRRSASDPSDPRSGHEDQAPRGGQEGRKIGQASHAFLPLTMPAPPSQSDPPQGRSVTICSKIIADHRRSARMRVSKGGNSNSLIEKIFAKLAKRFYKYNQCVTEWREALLFAPKTRQHRNTAAHD